MKSDGIKKIWKTVWKMRLTCCAIGKASSEWFCMLEILYLSLIGIILRWGFLIWEFIFLKIYCGLFVLILVVFLCCFFFPNASAKFHLWPSSDDLPRPRIGILSLVTVSPVITAFHSCCLSHHLSLSFYGSRWALSEDSGFKSYPNWPEVYLVKNVVWLTTTMEGSNYWGYGYKTQHSYPRSR